MESAEVTVLCEKYQYEVPLRVAHEEASYGCSGCQAAVRKYERLMSSEDQMILPADSASRKEIPITTGVLDYFPLAIAGIARISKKGNDKHNPGQPLHWSRNLSQDHADCIPRHLIDRTALDPDTKEPHYLSMAWRALALAQLEEEKRLGKPISRGSK